MASEIPVNEQESRAEPKMQELKTEINSDDGDLGDSDNGDVANYSDDFESSVSDNDGANDTHGCVMVSSDKPNDDEINTERASYDIPNSMPDKESSTNQLTCDTEDIKAESHSDPSEFGNTDGDQNEGSYELLRQVIQHLELENKYLNGRNGTNKNCSHMRHSSLNKQTIRKIEEENIILARRLKSYQGPPKIPIFMRNHYQLPQASAAVNRKKRQRSIERNNQLLMRKIEHVKGTTHTMDHIKKY